MGGYSSSRTAVFPGNPSSTSQTVLWETAAGLWSIGFHPRYQENGYVFAHYAEMDAGDSIISRFRLSDDPNELDESSEAVLLRMPRTNQVHYGGQLRFGPDGYLYASTGDSTGRSGGPDPGCVAQSPDSLEGKILRLDVDQGSDAPPFHTSPDDNPFVDSGRPEVWALGLRNPWRFSFDPEGGDLWISDVGHERREEMNFLQAGTAGGANFGWKVMEGTRCLGDLDGCGADLPACDDASLIAPAIEYNHSDGACSVIGGPVYRGRLLPHLFGKVLYGDFCSGAVWAASEVDGLLESSLLEVALPDLTAFGEDAQGEVYLTSLDAVYQLVDRDLPAAGLVEFDQAAMTTPEDAGQLLFGLRRVGGSAGAVSVAVEIVSGTADPDEDFDLTSTVVNWDDGQEGLESLAIDLIDDIQDEANETIQLRLIQPLGGAELGARSEAEILIVDNDLCLAGPDHLCLGDGRFRVSTTWRTSSGTTGIGQPVILTPDTGYFWFFQSTNVELVLKVLAGCTVNDRFWVFAGGLTNVEVRIEVTDTVSAQTRIYESPLGTPFVPLQDTQAFATCP